MIDVSIRKLLGSFRLDVQAASDARTLGLLGPSGSGKSTLLNCIAGLLRPDEGRIVVSGRILAESSTQSHLAARRRGIGYVIQDGLLFPHLSVLKNLKYGLDAHGKGPTLEEVVHILELGELLKRDSTTLSGGQARRVAIGRALLSGPRLLLLDEPLSGLDRTLALKTLHYLKRVAETFHVPMLYVSHTPGDVVFLCDDAWLLDQGRIIATGPPRQLLTHGEELDRLGDADFYTAVPAKRDDSSGADGTTYRVGGLALHCAFDNFTPHEYALLSIHANDIIITSDKPERISARNVIPAEVITVGLSKGRAVITLRVDSRSPDWVVRLTPAAVRELQIETGSSVYAIVKATSIRAVPIGPHFA